MDKWYTDEYGMMKLWVVMAVVFLCIFGMFGIGIGVEAVGSYYEVRAFNNIHGTNYTFGEWFWAEHTIKDYHLGTIENKRYEVDLNLNQGAG